MAPIEERRRAGGPRLAAAVGAATAAACATSLVCGFAFVVSEGGLHFTGGAVGFSLLLALVALIVCPTLFVIVGLPLYALSIRLNWVSLPAYMAGGFTTSVLATLLFPELWQFTALFLLPGGTAATVAFWFIVRPDGA